MERRELLVLVGLGSAATTGCLRFQQTASDSDTGDIQQVTLTERWAADTGIDYIKTDGGQFYFNGWNTVGRAVPGDQILWTSKVVFEGSTGNLGADAIGIGDGVAVFGFFSERGTVEQPGGHFTAHDTTTGEELWTVTTPAPTDESTVIPKNAVIVDGVAVLTMNLTRGGFSVRGIDAATGKQLWTSEPDNGFPQYLDSFDEQALLGLGSTVTYLDPRSGTELSTNESWGGSLGKVHGTSLFTISDSNIHRFPLTKNGASWSTDLDEKVNNLEVDNSLVVVGTADGGIQAFNRLNGEQKWETSINGTVWQIELTSNNVWVADKKTGLTAYARPNGQNVHRSTQPIERSDIGIVSETILFGTDQGRAYDIQQN